MPETAFAPPPVSALDPLPQATAFVPPRVSSLDPLPPPPPPPEPSITPATDQAAAEQPSVLERVKQLAATPSPEWLQPAEERAKAFVEGTGVPSSLQEVKDFVTRSPIQDVKDIYGDVTQIPERVRNIGETLQTSPAAKVIADPLSPESFGTYGTVAGLLAPGLLKGKEVMAEKAKPAPEAPPLNPEGTAGFARVQVPDAPLAPDTTITEDNMGPVANQIGLQNAGKLPEVPIITAADPTHGGNVSIPIGATLEEATALKDAKAAEFSASDEERPAAVKASNDLYQQIQDRIDTPPPPTETPGAVAEPDKPDFRGPGTPAAGEIAPPSKVSLANAEVDKQRAARGELPMMSEMRKSNETTWDEGMERVERNPNLGAEMVDDIRRGDKTDFKESDVAVLMHEKVRVANEFAMETDRAFDMNSPEEDRFAAQQRATVLLDRMNEIDQATKRAGTVSARSLQWRQALVNDDYTFANQARKAAVAKGRPLEPKEVAQVKAATDEIAAVEAEATKKEAQVSETGSTEAGQAAVTRLRRDRTTAPVSKDELLTKMRARIADGDAPRDLGSYIQKIALAFVREGITERNPLVEAVHNFTSDVTGFDWRQTQDAISGYGDYRLLDKETAKVQLRGIKGELQQLGKLQDMKAGEPPLKTGMERRSPTDEERRLMKKVNEAKKKGGFNVTDPAKQLRSALDAIETRLKNSIKDAAHEFDTGERPPEKGGSPTSPEIEQLRALRDRVQESLEEVSSKVEVSPEIRAGRAKAALERVISELDRRLREDDYSIKNGNKPIDTPELNAMRKHRDALRAQLKEFEGVLYPEREMNKKIKATEKLLKKQMAEMGQAILTNERIVRTKPTPITDAGITRLRDLHAQLKADYEQIFEKPGLTDEQKMARAEAYLKRQVKDLEERIRTKNYASRVKQPPVVENAAVTALREKVAGLKDNLDTARYQDQQARRSKIEKASDWFVKWRRFNVISGVTHTLPKIAIVGQGRILSTAADTAMGAVLKRVPYVGRVIKAAPREGSTSVGAMAKGYVQGWQDMIRQAGNVLKTGKTGAETRALRGLPVDHTILSYMGNVHALLKLPAFAQEYRISLRARTEFEMRRGTDMTQPINQMRVNNEAVQDGLRAKLSQDNLVTKRLQMVLNSLRMSKEHPTMAKVIEKTIRFLLPVTHIPSNWFAESLTYTNVGLGLPRALTKTIIGLRKGLDKLSPAEVDSIARHWKKGSIGGGLMLLGYYMRDDIGGYYQGGLTKEEKDSQPQFGGMRIGDYDIPRWALHMPILEPLQFGATIGHVLDRMRAKTGETSLTDAAIITAAGLADENPYSLSARNATEMLAPDARGGYARSEFAKSALVPRLLSDISEIGEGDIKRKPKTTLDHIKMGIPGLRQTVPEKE